MTELEVYVANEALAKQALWAEPIFSTVCVRTCIHTHTHTTRVHAHTPGAHTHTFSSHNTSKSVEINIFNVLENIKII